MLSDIENKIPRVETKSMHGCLVYGGGHGTGHDMTHGLGFSGISLLFNDIPTWKDEISNDDN
jgi:hypothetical protein